jgi:hypothetical protein
MKADLQIEQAQAVMDIAEEDQSHSNKMDEIRLQNSQKNQSE